MLLVPELDFEVESGTLGGCFTTVEGLLVQARDQLSTSHLFCSGDSATAEDRSKFTTFLEKMNKVCGGLYLQCAVVFSCGWCIKRACYTL